MISGVSRLCAIDLVSIYPDALLYGNLVREFKPDITGSEHLDWGIHGHPHVYLRVILKICNKADLPQYRVEMVTHRLLCILAPRACAIGSRLYQINDTVTL